MKKVLLLTALSAGILFSSCKKDDTPATPAAPTCTLSKVTNSDATYSVYARVSGSNKYLTVKNYPPSGSYSSYSQYEYSGDMVSKIAYFNGANQLQYYLTFEKTSYGELVHVQVPAGGIFVEQGQLEYHMSGSLITQVIIKSNSQGSFVPTTQEDYTFANGNVTKVVSQNLQNQSTTTTTYTYDSKKNPYHVGDFGPSPSIQSTNNIMSMTQDGTTESYTYTYNSTGFAETRNTVGVGKSTVTYAYTGCN
jgi:hypothetical protein